MENPRVSAAIKELRKLTGLNQADFGKLHLNRSWNTVQLYERRGMPPPLIMHKLIELARTKGRNDLAAILRLGLKESIPKEVVDQILTTPKVVRKR